MKKERFVLEAERLYAILEETIKYGIWAENSYDAFILTIADLADIYAVTEGDAKEKGKNFIDSLVGQNWSSEGFITPDIDFETIDGIVYRNFSFCES